MHGRQGFISPYLCVRTGKGVDRVVWAIWYGEWRLGTDGGVDCRVKGGDG